MAKERFMKKVVAVNIILTMVLYYFIFIGLNVVSYAAGFGKSSIDFESYFKQEDGNKVVALDTTTTQEVYLYLNIGVREDGYFKGQVSFENSNFELDDSFKDPKVERIESNVIYLNQINSGESAEIKVKIKQKQDEKYALSNLSKETNLKLSGSLVMPKKEKEIQEISSVRVTYKSPYTSQEESTFDAKIITNKIYKINDTNKRVIQVLVGTQLNKNSYPVKQTNIELTAPENTENVEVYSRGTNLTNGKAENEFSKDEWNFNKQNKKVNINLENKIEKNEADEDSVAWKKDSKDMLIVTYILPEDVNLENAKIKANSQILLYDETAIKAEKELELAEEKTGIVNIKVTPNENKIYKGKIYSREERKIDTNVLLDIRYSGIENNILFAKTSSNFQIFNKQTENKEVIKQLNANIETNKITVSKNELLNILGQNGNFKIIEGQENIGINKQTIQNLEQISSEETKFIEQNGVRLSLNGDNLEIEFLNARNNLVYNIENAENQGTLNIKLNETLKPTEYDNSILKQIENLNQAWTIKDISKVENNIGLQETTTRMYSKIKNPTLAPGMNKNVTLMTMLRNDSEKYDLYNNPSIEIGIPQEITDVKINNIKTLYLDGLQDNGYTLNKTESGRNILKVNLQGEQTGYPVAGNIKGTYVIIDCDLTLSSNVEKTEGNINFKVTNNKDVNYYDNGQKEEKLTYIIPTMAEKLETKAINNVGANPQIVNNVGASENDITVTKTVSAGDKKDVREREILKYTITLKNNTSNDLKYVSLTDEIPKEVTYTTYATNLGKGNGFKENSYIKKGDEEYITETTDYTSGIRVNEFSRVFETLAAKSEISVSYYVVVNKDSSNIGKTFGTSAVATVVGSDYKYTSNKIENNIVEGKIEIVMTSPCFLDESYDEGDELSYIIKVINLTNEDLKDVNVYDEISSNLEYIKSTFLGKDIDGTVNLWDEKSTPNDGYNESQKTVTWKIGTLKAGETVGLTLDLKVKAYTGDVSDMIFKNQAYATANNVEKQKSNIFTINRTLMEATISMTNDIRGTYIEENRSFSYTISIKNTSKTNLIHTTLTDALPKGIIPEQAILTTNESSYNKSLSEGEDLNLEVTIMPGEEATVNIYCTTKQLEENVKTLEISNTAVLKNLKSNTVTNIIQKAESGGGQDITPDDGKDDDGKKDDNTGNNDDNKGNNNNDDNKENNNSGNTSKGYSISGLIWLDQDKNGLRNEAEEKIANVKVELLKYSDMSVVQSENTSSDGTYEFNNLSKDKYIVKFNYDEDKYGLTDYQKENVSDDRNSDVMESDEAGIAYTDILELQDYNITNIDMGLVNIGKFDLKIEKTITDISISNNKETKSTHFNESQLAKAEVSAKLVNSSLAVVTYQIKVVNEGEVEGYVNEITDYLPDGMEFKSNLNDSWYESEGVLKSNAFAAQTIKPGNSKTITLVLTKKLSGSNLGLMSNKAELTSINNKNSIEDDNEKNNSSTANAIISIKTGEKIEMAVLGILSIGLIVTVIYLTKKYILTKN